MLVEFIVRVVAEVPDNTNIKGLHFGDKFDIISTDKNAELVDYCTESVQKLQEE